MSTNSLYAGAKGALTVSTTPQRAFPQWDHRTSAIMYNNGSITIYWGLDNTVSSSTGMPLPAGASYNENEWGGDIWVVTASGTADLRLREVGYQA